MKKRVLLTGGSHSELPLIDTLHSLGYFVITVDNNPNGIGAKAADLFVLGDIRDKDCILSIALDQNVCGIISGCNDFAYISTAYACEKLGFMGHDSYETAKLIHNKNEFCQLLESLNIKCPKTIQFSDCSQIEDLSGNVSYPILIKAISLTAGKGIRICNNYNDVISAYNELKSLSPSSLFIIQEYVYGSNHGASFLIKDCKVSACFIDDEQYHYSKYFVAGACTSGSVPYESRQILINDVEKICGHLKLVDGLFHVQFILDKNGLPIMVDPCRRAPGDLYILLAKHSTGYDYPLHIVKSELGNIGNISVGTIVPCYPRWIIRECILPKSSGKIKSIHIDETVSDSIIYKIIWAHEGDIIDNISDYKAGIVIAEFSSKDEMLGIVSNFDKLVYIEVENG